MASSADESRRTIAPLTGVLHSRVVEIVPDRVYYAAFSSPPTSDANVRYVCLDDKVHYDAFYSDFGPLNLAVIHRLSRHILILIKNRVRAVFLYSSAEDEAIANGAFAMGCFLMSIANISPRMAYLKMSDMLHPDQEFKGFRDASTAQSTYDLDLFSALSGFHEGRAHSWYDRRSFDADEYEFYERVENGDLNWIIPDKMLAFCGPHDKSVVENGYPYHAPEVYFDYFRSHNVSTIVRLNAAIYDAKRFTDAGFDHVDLYFIDGSTPSDEIVRKFIKVVDHAKGAVAVHCKAGLGRTGTLIACWMMKEFGMTAEQCISWLRICRPGSVIGPQQQFLLDKQDMCFEWGRILASNRNIIRPVTNRTKVEEEKKQKPYRDYALRRNVEERVDAEGRTQGDRLLACKARNAQQHAIFSSPTTPIKPLHLKPVTRASLGTRSVAVRSILQPQASSSSTTSPPIPARSDSYAQSPQLQHLQQQQQHAHHPHSLPLLVMYTLCTPRLPLRSLERLYYRNQALPLGTELRIPPPTRSQPYPISSTSAASGAAAISTEGSRNGSTSSNSSSTRGGGIMMEMGASAYALRPRRVHPLTSLALASELPPNAAALGALVKHPNSENVKKTHPE